LKVMNKWPAWDRTKSPPPLKGDLPGSQAAPRPAAKVERPPPAPGVARPVEAQQAPKAVAPAPVAAALPGPERPSIDEQTLMVPPIEAVIPAIAPAVAPSDNTVEVNIAPVPNAPKLPPASDQPGLMIEATPGETSAAAAAVHEVNVETREDGAIVVEFSDDGASAAPVEEITTEVKSPLGGIVKHFAIMGGTSPFPPQCEKCD